MTAEAIAAHLSEVTANLDAYIDARAQERAEEMAKPIRAELVEARDAAAFEVQRREDLVAELRRQMAVLEKRANAATDMVHELTDPLPCRYVNAGHGCVTHGWPHGETPCPHARAKALYPRRVRPGGST